MPVIAGVRICKKTRKRTPAVLFDKEPERYRDDRYYHYLTKWMHALNRASGQYVLMHRAEARNENKAPSVPNLAAYTTAQAHPSVRDALPDDRSP
jgi:hypothetical protein